MIIYKGWRSILGLSLAILCLIIEFVLFMKIDDGFHDSQTFLDAFDLISDRENPYLDPYFLNSYTLALPFSKYASLFPAPFGSTLWNLINAGGIILFISLVSLNKSWPTKLWILSMVIATSPARAMFASVQHTGIILGFLALSFFLAKKGQQMHSPLCKILSGIVAIIPFELKPQFAIPLILIYIVRSQYHSAFWTWICSTLFLHLCVSLYFKMPLDKYWIERLIGRSEVTTNVNSGDNSLWIIPSSLFRNSHFWLVTGFIAYVIALLVLARFALSGMTEQKLFTFSTIIPLTLPYVHTYDYLVICVVLSMYFFRVGVRDSINLSLMIFLLPTITDASNLLFKVLISLALYFGFAMVRTHIFRGKSSFRATVGILVFSTVYYLIYDNFRVDNLRVSLLLTLGALLSVHSARNLRRKL